ncbi:arabinan endo-1,5-alpha-L-arabinosidase [Cellvibrio sp. KY-GH-1]|uniref:arabinan endo-1,5-alpha-L-arabinosidase n=1 Tax=Cellvibrio sp. KY-GH-1 TaxID=2303332 RepID=UPI001247D7CB|nr:arabinan endo-1,5-alpha-L-arabinosidase [Cellvibrio sp. KY-GH-1]QEY18240.1 arabinan endo-1,5-alpha-L-arabinosidase [Cellvibrio sp. KY-GH-1]
MPSINPARAESGRKIITKALKLLGTSALLCLAGLVNAKQVDVHDPVMTREGDTWYLFSTGPGITIYSSKDQVNWRLSDRAFATEPVWAKSVAPGFNGHLWAPDIIQHNNLFYLYYSVSAFGKNTSAIGVTVNKTLDPTSPDYRWEDKGIVLQSVPNRDAWNAIDPAVIVDEKGQAWMSFGSFWSGLKVFKLNADWTRPAEPQEWHSIAKRDQVPASANSNAGPGEIEAPFILKKGEYYYLFASWGLCCKGANSTYHLVVGRSKSVTGPYVDRAGKDMNDGGGSLLIRGNKNWVGLGHNSAYTWDGKDYLVLHAYETADNYLQKLKILNIHWDKEGWPLVNEKELDSYQSNRLK